MMWFVRLYYLLCNQGCGAVAGEYNKNKADGMYRCGGCGAELYKCVCLYDLFVSGFSVAACHTNLFKLDQFKC